MAASTRANAAVKQAKRVMVGLPYF
jgi:hypothetical protein